MRKKKKKHKKQTNRIFLYILGYYLLELIIKIWRSEKTILRNLAKRKYCYLPTKATPPPLSLSLSLVLFAENRKLDLVVPCDDAIAELSCQQRWPRTTAAAVSSSLLLLLVIVIIMLCWGDEAPTAS